MPVTIVNVGYRSTNFWLVSQGTTRMLVDLGWPGTIGTMRANLQRAGVSLLLDDGAVFTGDLSPPFLAADEEQAAVLRSSWQRLRERGATRIYPGHAGVRPMGAD